MSDERPAPSVDRDEFHAFRMVLAERADEVGHALLTAMRDKGYLREDRTEGWVVTLYGHQTYLWAVLATFESVEDRPTAYADNSTQRAEGTSPD